MDQIVNLAFDFASPLTPDTLEHLGKTYIALSGLFRCRVNAAARSSESVRTEEEERLNEREQKRLEEQRKLSDIEAKRKQIEIMKAEETRKNEETRIRLKNVQIEDNRLKQIEENRLKQQQKEQQQQEKDKLEKEKEQIRKDKIQLENERQLLLQQQQKDLAAEQLLLENQKNELEKQGNLTDEKEIEILEREQSILDEQLKIQRDLEESSKPKTTTVTPTQLSPFVDPKTVPTAQAKRRTGPAPSKLSVTPAAKVGKYTPVVKPKTDINSFFAGATQEQINQFALLLNASQANTSGKTTPTSVT